jgi:hypothetical protein
VALLQSTLREVKTPRLKLRRPRRLLLLQEREEVQLQQHHHQ